MTQLIRELIEAGWVERRTDPDDRRASALWLTEAGGMLASDVASQLGTLDREIGSVLSDAEYHMLTELLGRVFRSRL